MNHWMAQLTSRSNHLHLQSQKAQTSITYIFVQLETKPKSGISFWFFFMHGKLFTRQIFYFESDRWMEIGTISSYVCRFIMFKSCA